MTREVVDGEVGFEEEGQGSRRPTRAVLVPLLAKLGFERLPVDALEDAKDTGKRLFRPLRIVVGEGVVRLHERG